MLGNGSCWKQPLHNLGKTGTYNLLLEQPTTYKTNVIGLQNQFEEKVGVKAKVLLTK